MTELTLPLALFNLLPVAFTAFGLWWIACLIDHLDPRHGRLARVGAVAIVLGGAAKAAWKLILVLTGLDLTWLAAALFPLIAPGFALVAAAMAGAFLRQRAPVATGWLGPLVAVILACVLVLILARTLWLDIPRGWFLPLLTLASLANLALSLLAIATAWRLGRRDAALLLAVNLTLVFALPPIAVASPDTLLMHWLEQGLTALGTAAFAFGAQRLLATAQGDQARSRA